MGKNKYQGQKKFSKHKEKGAFDTGKEDELNDEAARLGITPEELSKRRQDEEEHKREQEESGSDSGEEKKETAPKPKPKGILSWLFIVRGKSKASP